MAACLLPSAIAHVSNVSGLALSLWMKGMPFSHGVATACAIAELFGALALALGLAPRLTVSALASSLVFTTGRCTASGTCQAALGPWSRRFSSATRRCSRHWPSTS